MTISVEDHAYPVTHPMTHPATLRAHWANRRGCGHSGGNWERTVRGYPPDISTPRAGYPRRTP